MLRNKGNAAVDLISTVVGLIFTAYVFLPQNTLNSLENKLSELFSPAEQVIEYDPDQK